MKLIDETKIRLDPSTKFWRWVKARLAERYAEKYDGKMTAYRVAMLLGMQPSYVSCLLSGKCTSKPSLYYLFKFKEACPDIDWCVIMGKVREFYGTIEAFKPVEKGKRVRK